MVHTIAGQRFDTGLIRFRAAPPTGQNRDRLIRYRIEIAGIPMWAQDFGPSEAEEVLAVVDEALDFVANRVKQLVKVEGAAQ